MPTETLHVSGVQSQQHGWPKRGLCREINYKLKCTDRYNAI